MGGNKQSLRKEEKTLVLPGTECRDEFRYTFNLKLEQSQTSRGDRNGMVGCLWEQEVWSFAEAWSSRGESRYISQAAPEIPNVPTCARVVIHEVSLLEEDRKSDCPSCPYPFPLPGLKVDTKWTRGTELTDVSRNNQSRTYDANKLSKDQHEETPKVCSWPKSKHRWLSKGRSREETRGQWLLLGTDSTSGGIPVALNSTRPTPYQPVERTLTWLNTTFLNSEPVSATDLHCKSSGWH